MTPSKRAQELDDADPLAPFLDRFAPVPDGLVYLDGNSLGRLPLDARTALQHAVDEQWGERLIRGWSEGWMELPLGAGDRLGATMLGAAPGQTVLADSTTVCFYKLCAAALAARPDRHRIVTDTANFPTDRYVLEGLAAQHGKTVDWIDGPGADSGPTPEDVERHLSDDTALVSLSHVDYRSAHIADLKQITRLAHDAGALVVWDLSHSAGAVPVTLDADGADLAVGCTYKFLCGGPGAPAFMYVAHDLQDVLRQPIQGWWGRRDPFAMAPGYDPADGVAKLLSGTPSILGLTAAAAGIELCAEAGIEAIRAKSIALTAFAIELSDAILASHDVGVGSPRDPARRGGHVALVHPEARDLSRRLLEAGVIVDFREPDVVRLGLSPLTTRFADVDAGVRALEAIFADRNFAS